VPAYPGTAKGRDQWILARRGPRNRLDPGRPFAFHVEQERSSSGTTVEVATLFLTNRECPFRCLMCDLWQNTLMETVAPGNIPDQIEHALARLPFARQIKLYNSGSFFDPRAIPLEDYLPIARQVSGFEQVIVESHPAFLGGNCLRFREMIGRPLEVAIGLETAHPEVLDRLNKRMTLERFARAAEFLRRNRIELRVFLLVNPPFMEPRRAIDWVRRSILFAFEQGASVVSLIPTRKGNGAIEALLQSGDFSPPRLPEIESAQNFGLGLGRGRVFADLWELEPFAECPGCFSQRKERMRQMNLKQTVLPPVQCHCGTAGLE
jgi:archaeosine synthase beta-subunit